MHPVALARIRTIIVVFVLLFTESMVTVGVTPAAGCDAAAITAVDAALDARKSAALIPAIPNEVSNETTVALAIEGLLEGATVG